MLPNRAEEDDYQVQEYSESFKRKMVQRMSGPHARSPQACRLKQLERELHRKEKALAEGPRCWCSMRNTPDPLQHSPQLG